MKRVVLAFDHVAIVATDRAGGLIMIGNFPAVDSAACERQQPALDLCRQFQVFFERALFAWS